MTVLYVLCLAFFALATATFTHWLRCELDYRRYHKGISYIPEYQIHASGVAQTLFARKRAARDALLLFMVMSLVFVTLVTGTVLYSYNML